MTVDELVRDAIERRLGDIRREKLFAYGKERTRALGIREDDVEELVHQHREESEERVD